MTRMIERWFPCQEVSDRSTAGWGSGNREKAMFSWFAARPLAQAKAATICSLLPWPDDPAEQAVLQSLVRRAMSDRDAAHDELVAELKATYPEGATVLDPFSGRAMIPLEGARLGVTAWGIDYSPVATLGGSLLADYPLRDWEGEPPLPFGSDESLAWGAWAERRLERDVAVVLEEVRRSHHERMAQYYPTVEGRQPWGYLWALTLPCQNCDHRFPLVGSLVLRYPDPKRNDPGEWFALSPNSATPGQFVVEVREGEPDRPPTRVRPANQSRHSSKGKVGVCLFCDHVHEKSVLERLARERRGEDTLLLVGDLDPALGKHFRVPTRAEYDAAEAAASALPQESDFAPGLPAVPSEPIPGGNTWTVQPSLFGAETYGDLCNARQTLSFVRLARAIDDVAKSLLQEGTSHEYTAALAGYAAAVMVRKLRRSTRGSTLQTYRDGRPTGVHDVFGSSESSIAFSYDYFEVGLTSAAGGWSSIAERTQATLSDQLSRARGAPARIQRGTATMLPLGTSTVDAVVTDPPYDDMIDYSDASDFFYVWLKRALVTAVPEMSSTAHPLGVQEKDEEVIVKKGGSGVKDHRTRAFYDRMLADAFSEAARVVKPEGVVSIVFGHGDPEVWHRLLSAISSAGLVLTGSWPARTEKGGRVGSANIQTTLTLACRPAQPDRPIGRVAQVDAEVAEAIRERHPLWDAAGLALTDQLMASAGPAMEVVGRYSAVLDKAGNPVALDRYLPLARRFVEEAADIRVDTLPLETFDHRTRFGLFWARLYERGVAAASEARWQRLASDLTEDETRGVLLNVGKGVRLAYSSEVEAAPQPESSVIDVALAVAGAGKSVAAVADVLLLANRADDPFVWAAMGELSRLLPEADGDADIWTWVVRNKGAITAASRNIEAAKVREEQEREAIDKQESLFGGDD